MVCDECKKNQATYHSITKINGVTTEKHLCPACYRKASSGELKFTDIGGLFSGFKSFFEPPKKRISAISCKDCGTTAEEFLETGFLGCSACYRNMSEAVGPVIKNVQSSDRHIGKRPLGAEPGKKTEYERLSEELKKAVDAENYEKALEIRDKMRSLKEDR